MKRITILISLAALFLFASCKHYEEFELTGTVVDYEYCQSQSQDFGYLVALDSPSDIGVRVAVRDGSVYDNVIVVYQADRLLKDKSRISASAYLDNNYNQAHCTLHYTYDDPDGGPVEVKVPQAVFTKLKVL